MSGNAFYDAAKQAILDAAPDILNPEGALVYQEVEVPCHHHRLRRFVDRLRGEPHGRTHIITKPIIYMSLVDNTEPGLTLSWDKDGRFMISSPASLTESEAITEREPDRP